jgi:hypothetical protein
MRNAAKRYKGLPLISAMVARVRRMRRCDTRQAIALIVADVTLPQPTYFFLDVQRQSLFPPGSFMYVRLVRALEAIYEIDLTLQGCCPKDLEVTESP